MRKMIIYGESEKDSKKITLRIINVSSAFKGDFKALASFLEPHHTHYAVC